MFTRDLIWITFPFSLLLLPKQKEQPSFMTGFMRSWQFIQKILINSEQIPLSLIHIDSILMAQQNSRLLKSFARQLFDQRPFFLSVCSLLKAHQFSAIFIQLIVGMKILLLV